MSNALTINTDALNKAYQAYAGQIVYMRVKRNDDPNGRHQFKWGFKPFGYADGTPFNNSREDGVNHFTIFFADGDEEKKYTDIHKMQLALRDLKCKTSDDAIGKVIWVKDAPPRNGFNAATLPVATPRINSQTVTLPPVPDDWDFEAWLEKYSNADEVETTTEGNSLPAGEYDRIINLLDGKKTALMAKTLLGDDELVKYGAGELSRAVETLIKNERLAISDGAYVVPVSA